MIMDNIFDINDFFLILVLDMDSLKFMRLAILVIGGILLVVSAFSLKTYLWNPTSQNNLMLCAILMVLIFTKYLLNCIDISINVKKCHDRL